MSIDKILVDEKIRYLEARCRQNGLALTVQRRVILETLAKRKDHPTADQLYDEVMERLKGVSRTTVYRVLETLVEIGVVQKINSPEAKARFDADVTRHHHAFCVHCNKVQDIHDAALNDIQLPVNACAGFDFKDFSINFSGVCSDCRDDSTMKKGDIT